MPTAMRFQSANVFSDVAIRNLKEMVTCAFWAAVSFSLVAMPRLIFLPNESSRSDSTFPVIRDLLLASARTQYVRLNHLTLIWSSFVERVLGVRPSTPDKSLESTSIWSAVKVGDSVAKGNSFACSMPASLSSPNESNLQPGNTSLKTDKTILDPLSSTSADLYCFGPKPKCSNHLGLFESP